MLDEIYPRLLLELCTSSLGYSELDIQRMLERLSDPRRARQAYGQLVKEIYQQNPDSDIGLRFGQHLHPPTLCDFSRALMTADDLRSSLNLVERFHLVHGASYYVLISERGEALSITLSFPFKRLVPEAQRRFCVEAVFSYILNALRETVSAGITPAKIGCEYAMPGYAAEVSNQFACPVSYQQPVSVMELDARLLQRKLITRDKVLHQIYLNKCLEAWRHSERLQDFEYRTVACLMRNHPSAFNSHSLADMLNISVRGLQKRLSKHNTSFSALASLARRELAKIYLLHYQRDIDFTAEQLGFQTTSGFRRFFKTEFAQTPAEYVERYSRFGT